MDQSYRRNVREDTNGQSVGVLIELSLFNFFVTPSSFQFVQTLVLIDSTAKFEFVFKFKKIAPIFSNTKLAVQMLSITSTALRFGDFSFIRPAIVKNVSSMYIKSIR